jgi:hypothetical protein
MRKEPEQSQSVKQFNKAKLSIVTITCKFKASSKRGPLNGAGGGQSHGLTFSLATHIALSTFHSPSTKLSATRR